MTPAKQSIATIESFLTEVGGNTKTAEAHTEAGSIGGATTHPVKSVEDHTSKATEGARSAENTKDVKADQGKPSVDSTPEKKADESNPPANYGIGTKVAPTGEDPENETSGTKPGKEDPGSSHPARTDNESLNGGKYAFDIEAAPLEKLAGAMRDLGNDLCSGIVAEMQKSGHDLGGTTPAPVQNGRPAKPATVATNKQANAVDPKLAQQVGWEMAGLMSGTLDKQAADAMVVNTLGEIIKEAEADAGRTAEFLTNYFTAQRQKRAEGPPGGPPQDGGGAGGDDASIASALGGGGAGGPPGADPAAGGPPGGDPAAGGPPGAGGGGEAELMQLLQQLGVTPEELEQAIMAEQQGGGAGGPPGAGGGMPPGAGGGMPPGAGGPPPGAGGPPGMPPGGAPAGGPPPGMEVQGSDKLAGHSKAAIANVIQELIGRSRAKSAAARR